jgi:hypothetical protein
MNGKELYVQRMIALMLDRSGGQLHWKARITGMIDQIKASDGKVVLDEILGMIAERRPDLISLERAEDLTVIDEPETVN